MPRPYRWIRISTFLAAAAIGLLILQYVVGLWTNVYAPAQFDSFDSGANYPLALNVHIVNGDVLFLLSVAAVVVTALGRQWRLVVPAVVLAASVYVAGQFGMMYVNTSPNDPVYSFGMGVTFLVALFGASALIMLSRSRWTTQVTEAAPPGAQSLVG